MTPAGGNDFYTASIGLDAIILLLISLDPNFRKWRDTERGLGVTVFFIAQGLLLAILAAIAALAYGSNDVLFSATLFGTVFPIGSLSTTLADFAFGEHRFGLWLKMGIPVLMILLLFAFAAAA